MVMAKEAHKLAITKCPTYIGVFGRFVNGLHKRMGDVVKQDKSLSQMILMKIFVYLDIEWNYVNSKKLS